MVDVGAKATTSRVAIAEGEIQFSADVTQLLQSGQSAKGDVLTVAKIAAIMAAKRTAELIPLCHPLPLSFVDVNFEVQVETKRIVVRGEARTSGQTGVEMEALTAVSVALLTIYDMTKSADKNMVIGNVRLMEKHGGKSGSFVRDAE
jgi:cyclic pyranopterin phosphate synthase